MANEGSVKLEDRKALGWKHRKVRSAKAKLKAQHACVMYFRMFMFKRGGMDKADGRVP
jgi:hypothetical protein